MYANELDYFLYLELGQLGLPKTAPVCSWWRDLSDRHRARVRNLCKPLRIGESPGEMLEWEFETLAIEADHLPFQLEALLRCLEEYPWDSTPERGFRVG